MGKDVYIHYNDFYNKEQVNKYYKFKQNNIIKSTLILCKRFLNDLIPRTDIPKKITEYKK